MIDSIRSNAFLLFIIFLFLLENLKTQTMLLTIEGVPAVLSDFREKAPHARVARCRRRRILLRKRCFPASVLPLYALLKEHGRLLMGKSFGNNELNFTKAGRREKLLLRSEGSAVDGTKHLEKAPAKVNGSNHPVAIDVNPIEYCHLSMFLCLPKRMDRKSFSVHFQMGIEAKNIAYFVLGCDRLQAYATIHHLYFQGCYLSGPFALAKGVYTTGGGSKQKGENGSCILDFPRRYLLSEGGKSSQDLTGLSSNAGICLQENHISF